MNVLYLGPSNRDLIDFIKSTGDEVIQWEERLSANSQVLNNIDFIISYRYRHIIEESIIERFKQRAINLHISYLPWNKGSDPNLWSFLENTPKGVTIHYLDKGLDTGEILIQKQVDYVEEETLSTMYSKLSTTIEDLLKENWLNIKSNKITPTPQVGEGSYHKMKDKNDYLYLLEQGWDTPVKKIYKKAIQQGV